ncbi:hypothetical protein HMPREF1145_1146 [Oribacterium parvum ACB8]|nr:hypothetical protein HMPREF1145_1146 [Oribacterium parvum ACB8]
MQILAILCWCQLTDTRFCIFRELLPYLKRTLLQPCLLLIAVFFCHYARLLGNIFSKKLLGLLKQNKYF